MRRPFLFLCFFLALCFSLETAYAASYSIDPSKIRVVVPSPGSYSGSIKIQNRSGEPLIIKGYMEDWLYASDQVGVKLFYPAGTTGFSCANWVSFNPPEVIIPARGTAQVNYVINVPAGVEGGHYAVMFFEAMLAEATGPAVVDTVGAGTALKLRIGAIFCVEVKGTVKRSAELSKFNVTSGKKKEKFVVTGTYKNTGNADIITSSSFHIMDKGGKIVGRGIFSDTYTLPGDTATTRGAWTEALPAGKYSLVVTLDLGKAMQEIKGSKSRGPVITKEAEIEIGENGQFLGVGEFK
ncbi:MAG: hypothetical protein PHR11_01935 [Candidatus Omnitrophica bacterium]|nr:hypothetical protein [Candidatus Omnitrophota bacterium]